MVVVKNLPTISINALSNTGGEILYDSTINHPVINNASEFKKFVLSDLNNDVTIGRNLTVTGPILAIPTGNTSGRPSVPQLGYIRYNSETSQFEGYGSGNSWGSLGGNVNSLTNATATGDFTISSHNGSTTGLILGSTLVTATAAEINYLDITTTGIAEASKALILNASRNITNINSLVTSRITADYLDANTQLAITNPSGTLITSSYTASSSYGLIIQNNNTAGTNITAGLLFKHKNSAGNYFNSAHILPYGISNTANSETVGIRFSYVRSGSLYNSFSMLATGGCNTKIPSSGTIHSFSIDSASDGSYSDLAIEGNNSTWLRLRTTYQSTNDLAKFDFINRYNGSDNTSLTLTPTGNGGNITNINNITMNGIINNLASAGTNDFGSTRFNYSTTFSRQWRVYCANALMYMRYSNLGLSSNIFAQPDSYSAEVGSGNFSSIIQSSTFVFEINGFITTDYTETYTFTFVSTYTKFRIWLNGILVAQDWSANASTSPTTTISAEAGKKISFYAQIQCGDLVTTANNTFEVRWQSSSRSVQAIPATKFEGTLTSQIVNRTAYSVANQLTVYNTSSNSTSPVKTELSINSSGNALIKSSGTLVSIDSSNSLDIASHNGSTVGLRLGGSLVTSTAAELNYLDTTPGTAAASKALVLDSNLDIVGIHNIETDNLTVNGTLVTSSAVELNYVDVTTIGVAQASKALVLDSNLDIVGIHNIETDNLTVNGTLVTSSAIELNYVDVTSIGVAEASKALVVDANRDISNINSLIATNLTGELQTASQPNITSVGTLTSLSTGSLTLNGTAITATAAELNSLSGSTATSTDFNKLASVIATSTELNSLSGSTATSTDFNKLASVTATSTELNTLSGITSSTSELNSLSGSTATSTDFNKLASVTATSTELNTLSGITSSTSELNSLSGSIATSTDFNKLASVTATSTELNTLSGINSSTSELNSLSGSTATSSDFNKLASVTASASELNTLSGITSTTSELNSLSGSTATSTDFNKLASVTASASELNTLSGITATVTELNYVDTTVGTAEASKALVLDSSRNITNINNLSVAVLNGTIVNGTGNSISYPITVNRTTSSTPANGLGCGISFNIQNSNNDSTAYGSIEVSADDITDNSEDGKFKINLITGGVNSTALTLTKESLLVEELVETSDRRVKENIVSADIKDSYEKIMALHSVNFNFIHDKDKRIHRGVIAQEVNEIIPSAVHVNANEHLSDFHSISTKELVGYMIGSLQYMNNKYLELENKYNELQKKYTELQN